jgi:hypothetical protein
MPPQPQTKVHVNQEGSLDELGPIEFDATPDSGAEVQSKEGRISRWWCLIMQRLFLIRCILLTLSSSGIF